MCESVEFPKRSRDVELLPYAIAKVAAFEIIVESFIVNRRSKTAKDVQSCRRLDQDM
jgi:hypothetical protein